MTSAKCNLRLDWATHEAAKFACTNWHYSKCLPISKLVKVGVWEDGKFVGVVIFSRGVARNLLKPYGIGQDAGCELARVALAKHKTEVSRIVAIAIRMFRKIHPALRLVVSFADPNKGHNGAIYQAGGWLYCGQSAAKPYYITPSGKQKHNRNITTSGVIKDGDGYKKCLRCDQCIRVNAIGKYRYLMPLDDDMRKQVEPLRKPYPKRVSSIVSDATGSQLVEGGAIPTGTLQTIEPNNG